jgi:hypothetical protein
MSSVYDLEVEDGVFEDVESPCVALVPVTPTPSRPVSLVVNRPDASFVTQLIANAAQLPQTRQLRRAAPEDALSAYRAFEIRIRDSRVSTRQVA